MSVGLPEILVIMVVALLVFGPQRLPEVARQVGAALREVRKMQDAVRGELDMVLHPEHGTAPTHATPVVEPGDHSVIDGGHSVIDGGHSVVDAGATPEIARGDLEPEQPASNPSVGGTGQPNGPFAGPSDSFL